MGSCHHHIAKKNEGSCPHFFLIQGLQLNYFTSQVEPECKRS